MDLFDVVVAKKLSGGGGGGNPNKVTTYAGTAADPFNGLSYEKQVEIVEALYHGDATMKVTFSIGGDNITVNFNGSISGVVLQGSFCVNDMISSDNLFALFVEWHTARNGITVDRIDVAQGSSGTYTATDYRSMAGSIATQTTITWHPMP